MHSRVLLALVRVSLMTAMQYRSSFLSQFVVGGLTAAATVVPLVFVFEHATTLAGWTFPETVLVTAFFLLMSAVVGGLVEPNLGAVVEGVRNGQLDYLLLKPADSQLLASFQRVDPARAWDLAASGVLGIWALGRLGPPSAGDFLVAATLLLAGLMAIYSLWILVICLSFWFVRVDNLRYLLGAVTDAGRWPVAVYRGWVRLLLTVVVPVALVTSWPAMALTGRMDGALAAQALGVGLGLFASSRFAWTRAVGRYTSASS